MDSRHTTGGPTRPSPAFVAGCVLMLGAAACTRPADSERPAAAGAAVVQPPVAAPAARPRSSGGSSASSFALFESGQVRPLALSPDGHHLFATNTPDNRLEIFRIEPHRLVHTGSVRKISSRLSGVLVANR